MERNYIAFISYRHLPLDALVADKVHEMIERYTIPRELRKNGNKHMGVAFRDREELPLTSDLTGDIYTALDHAKFLVVVCTPETPKSLWVTREIEYFISKHGRHRVLTVVAEGTIEESVPKAITHEYAEDGKTLLNVWEPLAAMIAAPTERQMLKLLKQEFLRLAAAMIGCPYDSLVQRNKKYRQQILSSMLGIAALVAFAFAGMLAVKNTQINQQLIQSQINESKALAFQSEEVLEDGARMEALELALRALPSDGNSRPYVPEAEKALVKALQIYETRNLRVNRALGLYGHLMKFSVNDETIVTVDDSGYVRCFDAKSGQEHWSYYQNSYSGSNALVELMYDGTVVLSQIDKTALVIDVNTGEVLRSAVWEGSKTKGITDYEGNLNFYEQLVLFDGYLNLETDTITVAIGRANLSANEIAVTADMRMDLTAEEFAICGQNEICIYRTTDGATVNVLQLSEELLGCWEHCAIRMNHDKSFLICRVCSHENQEGGSMAEVLFCDSIGQVTHVQRYEAEWNLGDCLNVDGSGPYVLFSYSHGMIAVNYVEKTMKVYEFDEDGYTASIDSDGNILALSGSNPSGEFNEIEFTDDWSVFFVPADYVPSKNYMTEEGYIRYLRSYKMKVSADMTAAMSFTAYDGKIYVRNYDDLTKLFVLEPVGQEYTQPYHAVEDEDYGDDYKRLKALKEQWNADDLWFGTDHMGMVSVEGTLYLCDLESGELKDSLSVSVPQPFADEAVYLVRNNTAVLVRTTMSNCKVIDLKTGEMQGELRIENADRDIEVAEDEAGEYLYIWSGINGYIGMRVDMESWTVVADIPGMANYFSSTEQIMQQDMSLPDAPFLCFPIFTTEELIALGEELLN